MLQNTNNLHYYYYHTETPFAGTDHTAIVVSETPVEFDYEEMIQKLFNEYGYLFIEDDDYLSEEEFKNECYVNSHEITEEEAMRLHDEGYNIELW